jgi:hypothetical protein
VISVSLVAEARAFANKLRDSLPSSVEVAALGVRSRAPFQVLWTREALIWRTEELARNACDALERDDFAAAALLTRAITESAAFAWKLLEVLDARQKHSTKELHDILMRLLGGSVKWQDARPPIKIMTCIDRMDKTFSGARANYDLLSEIAHPNCLGVSGLYSKIDHVKAVAHFGRGLGDADGTRGMIANSMLIALSVFEYAYNRISETIPAFLAELESVSADDQLPETRGT